jgi:hypothetical protein
MKTLAIAIMLCACNWKYEIVPCQPRQCHPMGKYTLILTDPQGQKYNLNNCPNLLLRTKKSATLWARFFKQYPMATLEYGSTSIDCLQPIN